ncbi:hypothetical protein ACYJ1Y_16125 [Natrialbaceae archaeon A-gly3]
MPTLISPSIAVEGVLEQYLPVIRQWLVDHGFQLSSREWASLAWVALIVAGIIYLAATNSRFRHQLANIFKIAFFSKLVFVWIGYALWIALFVLLADYFGYWQPTLTKATLVWSATIGIVTLVGFTEAQSLGYFKSAVLNLFRGVIVFEYFLGFATFPIWVEIPLQFFIFFFLVAPIVASDYQQRWSLISGVFFILLLLAMVVNSVLAIYTATNLGWGLILRQVSLPVILTLWVLMLALPLSIYAAYETVFTKMAILRNKERGLWKAKLGLLLALRHHLKYIREAEKGGAEVTHAARADTVRGAYREARKLVDEQYSQ